MISKLLNKLFDKIYVDFDGLIGLSPSDGAKQDYNKFYFKRKQLKYHGLCGFYFEYAESISKHLICLDGKIDTTKSWQSITKQEYMEATCKKVTATK